jgi:hypothetical protein
MFPSRSEASSQAPPTPIEDRVVDAMIQAYVDWREESSAVWDAYTRWSSVPSTDAGLAYAAYRAALDRERQAADVYADLIRRVGDVVRSPG